MSSTKTSDQSAKPARLLSKKGFAPNWPLKRYAKNLNHLKLPEIRDFNALDDERCLKYFVKRYKPDGTSRGGNVMSRGHLYHILGNPIYAGRIRHKGKVFDGQHSPLIDPQRWDQLQVQLSEKAPNKNAGVTKSQTASPLVGKIFDETGERLTPSHTNKAGKRYRYYVSRHKVENRRPIGPGSGWRIPAKQIEDALQTSILEHMESAAKPAVPPEQLDRKSIDPFAQIGRVQLSDGMIDVELIGACEAKLNIPFAMRRRGVEAKLIIADQSREPDATLVVNIARAIRWYELLKSGKSFEAIAKHSGTSKRRVQQMMSLAFLAPDIIRDVLNGRQP